MDALQVWLGMLPNVRPDVRLDMRLDVRLDVRDLAPAAPARAVPAEMAAAVQDSLHCDVARRLDGLVDWSAQMDEALGAGLGSVMIAWEVQTA